MISLQSLHDSAYSIATKTKGQNSAICVRAIRISELSAVLLRENITEIPADLMADYDALQTAYQQFKGGA